VNLISLSPRHSSPVPGLNRYFPNAIWLDVSNSTELRRDSAITCRSLPEKLSHSSCRASTQRRSTEADMTSFFSRKLLVLLAASLSLGSAAAFGKDSMKLDTDLVCRAELFAGHIPVFRSGDALPKEGIFTLDLQPGPDVVYFVRSSDEVPQSY